MLGGYDTSNIEHHDITDNSSHLVSVYRAYVVLDEFQLVRCTSLSQFPRMLLDYCSTTDGAGGCLGRSKIDIDDTGLTLPEEQTITFAQPLEIGGSVRHAYIAVGIAYGEWMHDVNAALLTSDMNERQKLFNNIASSLHVYSKGLGDLPANVAQ